MHGEVNPGGFSYKEPHYFDNGMPTAKEPAGGVCAALQAYSILSTANPSRSTGADAPSLTLLFILTTRAGPPHSPGPATRRVLHRFRVEADYLKRGLDSGRDVSRCTFGAADPDNLYGGRVIGSQAAARKVTRQEMIVESLPEARLIAILRDPVSRAFSQFRYVRCVAWQRRRQHHRPAKLARASDDSSSSAPCVAQESARPQRRRVPQAGRGRCTPV